MATRETTVADRETEREHWARSLEQANAERDTALWLHAEAVWRNQGLLARVQLERQIWLNLTTDGAGKTIEGLITERDLAFFLQDEAKRELDAARAEIRRLSSPPDDATRLRVARALFRADEGPIVDFDKVAEDVRADYLFLADAALTAYQSAEGGS